MDIIIFLQSKEKFADLLQLNYVTNEKMVIKKTSFDKQESIKISGAFSEIDGQLICFFRYQDQLFIDFDDDRYLIAPSVNSTIITPRSTQRILNILCGLVKINCKNETIFKYQLSRFCLKQENKTLKNIYYKPMENSLSGEIDYTPFIEDEDFDFFLFMHNVLNDTERRKNIFKSLNENDSTRNII